MPACPRSREGSSSSRNGADRLRENRGFCCVDAEARTASWPGLREGNGAAKGLLAGGEEPPAFPFSPLRDCRERTEKMTGDDAYPSIIGVLIEKCSGFSVGVGQK